MSVAFYESLNPSIALRVVGAWLEAINSHEHASSVDQFDKEGKTDLFALLPPVDQARPQICFVRFFHRMFRPLNAFTVDVDVMCDPTAPPHSLHALTYCACACALDLSHCDVSLTAVCWVLCRFDRALHVPFATPAVHAKAVALIAAGGADEKALVQACEVTVEEARVLLVACSHDAPHNGNMAADPAVPAPTLAALMAGHVMKQRTETPPPLANEPSGGGVSPRTPRTLAEAAFFTSDFVSTFGHLLGVAYPEADASHTLHEGSSACPLHFGAYLTCLLKLDGKDPLRCAAYLCSITKLTPARSPLHLCFTLLTCGVW